MCHHARVKSRRHHPVGKRYACAPLDLGLHLTYPGTYLVVHFTSFDRRDRCLAGDIRGPTYVRSTRRIGAIEENKGCAITGDYR